MQRFLVCVRLVCGLTAARRPAARRPGDSGRGEDCAPEVASTRFFKETAVWLSERDKWISTNGVTVNFMFFDRGTFWVLPLTYCYLPNSARAHLFFPQSVKTHYLCSGPIGADPVCPQPDKTTVPNKREHV